MNQSESHYYSSSGRHGESREVERRKTSSTIIKEEYIGQKREGEVRYVEVPVIEEVIRRVPKTEIVEVERVVPKYEYEYVDRIVEMPQIQYVDRQVEVPEYHEVIRHVSRREVVEVPKEVVRHVPRIENVIVEKTVEVPGQIVEVPKPYTVENEVPFARYVDNEVPMVVAQTIKPIITESNESVEIDVFEYEPQVVVIDVHVPKPVPSQLVASGMVEEIHRLVTVPAAQYNSMLKMLNVHIPEADQRTALPYITEPDGSISMLHTTDAGMMYPAPIPSAQVQGWTPGSNSTSTRQFVAPMQTRSRSDVRSSSMQVGPSRSTSGRSSMINHGRVVTSSSIGYPHY